MPFIVAGLCFLVLWIMNKLDWYKSTGDEKRYWRIWIIIGVVVLLFVIWSKSKY